MDYQPADVRKWLKHLKENIAKQDNKKIMQLLSHVTLTTRYDDDGNTLMHYVSKMGSDVIMAYLIDAGCDVNMKNNLNRPPLEIAIAHNHVKIAKMLIDAGAIHKNTYFNNACGPLHVAAYRGQTKMVEMLIKAGADVNARTREMNTPLHIAHRYEKASLLLIEAGSDVNAIDSFGSTSLHYAASTNSPEVVRLLLKNGAIVNSYDSEDVDPLCYGIKELGANFRYQVSRRSYVANVLYDYDRTIEECNPSEISKQLAVIKLLVKAGTPINRTNRNGLTALNVAVTAVNHSRVIKYLLRKGATFDYEDLPVRRLLKTPNNGSKIPWLLIRHTAMFDAQSRGDGPKNFCAKKQKKELQKLYAQCRDELELMRSTELHDSVTFFNLLSDKNIGPYARNELIVDAFVIRSEFIAKLFPNYCDLIIERFTKERRKQEYIKRATRSLNKILRWRYGASLPVIVTDNIMRSLPKKDLRSLASV